MIINNLSIKSYYSTRLSSFSTLLFRTPVFPVHGYTSGHGWHVFRYRTPDLCHKLHTFGLLQRLGRSCTQPQMQMVKQTKREQRMRLGERPHGTYRIITVKRRKVVKSRNGSRITSPLYGLPVRNQPNFRHIHNGVQKCDKTLLMVRLSEPRRMVE